MVDAADDPFEQLMEFEPGQEMGSAATSWEDTFGPAREPQLMPDERNAISPVFDDPSQQLLDDQARRAYPPQPTPTMRLRVTSMQVRVTRGLPVKPSAARRKDLVPDPRNEGELCTKDARRHDGGLFRRVTPIEQTDHRAFGTILFERVDGVHHP